MCGIAGFSCKHPVTFASVQNTVKALGHRGPDDSGICYERSSEVGLIHTRLAIQDLSPLGCQPMYSQDRQIVLVFNGEIYNVESIRASLVANGVSFSGRSDTEILLNLYLTEGEGMLSRLNGIFAFALWDRRKQKLLLARDAFGIKPLYYASSEGGFFFASEIKALLKLIPLPRKLNIRALQRYLTFLWCPGGETPFESMNKLGPGEAMVVKAGKVERRWCWYRLPVFRRNSKPQHSEVASIEGVRKYLRQAVHRQMIGDVQVGAFLSGGLDSSSVVAFAKELNPDIRCFTIEQFGGSEKGAIDDLPYARRVAKFLDVSLDVIRIDAKKMASDLENMIQQLDEPLADPAALNVLYISRLAREHGIKVLLSGTGGDDIFTGYRRHRALLAESLWSWLPGVMQKGLVEGAGFLDQRRVIARRLTKLFSGASLDSDARLVNYFHWMRRSDLEGLYSANFKAALGESKADEPMLDFLRGLPSNTSRLERMLALEQRFFLGDHNLLYTDKMSMAVGVEVRVPFLDMELVEFAASIPARFKQHGSEGKWVLKRAMEPFLPGDVIYRPKTGFGAPLRRWMRYELRELLNDLLSVESLSKRGLFDSIAVQKLIRDNDVGHVDASYTLFSLLCIEIWCRRFVDNNAARSVA